MVSMPSLHFFRWTEQLRDSGHEVYWFDITGMGTPSKRIDWVIQKTGWKLKWDFSGRIFIKKHFSKLYRFLQRYNEYDTSKVFESYLNEIKPDVVHSFALQISCIPILTVMQKYRHVKWIYSSWGSDLYARQKNLQSRIMIERILPYIDYLFVDCYRDYVIANEYGFRGVFLGVFPGGGGFDLKLIKSLNYSYSERGIILVKGYQGIHGKCIEIIEVLSRMSDYVSEYQIVVFGADPEVVEYVSRNSGFMDLNLIVKEKIVHTEVLQLMGRSKFYIGYSDSDGMPNTLLEAICSGCFPMQSNPGGATSELIKNNFNGVLLESNILKQQILEILQSKNLTVGLEYNENVLKPRLSFEFVKNKVIEAYNQILN